MENNRQKKKGKTAVKIFAICILVIIVILLLLRSCMKPEPQPKPPVGDYEISDERQTPPPKPQDVTETPDVGIITFDGWLKYKVSKDYPDMELTNPAENKVYFVFEIVDKNSGELIARTDKVAPGQYTYVNVADFYSAPGIYQASMIISTYDIETGAQRNGLDQDIEIEVN